MVSKFLSICKSIHRNLMTTSVYPKLHNYRNTNLYHYSPINCIQYSTIKHNNATYDEVKDVSTGRQKEVLLIDVREPQELETGALPSSINIPLGNLETTLRDMPNEEFLNLYGREKPNKNCSIIFSCKSGKRSSDACDIAHRFGFKNVKNYTGGWVDWEERSRTE